MGRFFGRDEATEKPGLAKKALGGFVLGLDRDPILSHVVRGFIDSDPNVDEEDLGRLRRDLKRSSVAKVSGFIGEFGPSLMAGFGLFGVGRAVGRAGVKALAPGISARGGRLSQQALDIMKRDLIDESTGIARNIPKPGLERGAEVLGGATGLGSLSGAQSAAGGGSPTEIAQSFGIGFVLSAGFETGLIGASRLLSPAGRAGARDPRKIKEAIDELEPGIREQLFGRVEFPKLGRDPETGIRLVGAPRLVRQAKEGSKEATLLDPPAGRINELNELRAQLSALLDVEGQFQSVARGQQLELFPAAARPGSVAASTNSPAAIETVQRSLRFKGPIRSAAEPTKDDIFTPKFVTPRHKLSPRQQLIQETQTKIAKTKNEIRILREKANPQMLEPDILSLRPVNPDSFRGHLNWLLDNLIFTPLGASRRMGVVAQDTVLRIARGTAREDIKRNFFERHMQVILQDLSKATGKKMPKTFTEADEVFKVEFDLWERGGLRALTSELGDDLGVKVARILDKGGSTERGVFAFTDDLIEPATEIGGLPGLSRASLRELGVENFIPHTRRGQLAGAVLEEKYVSAFMKQGMTRLDAEAATANIIDRTSFQGLRSLGSLEHNRKLTGSLLQKQQTGLDFHGPVTALLRHADEITHKVEMGRIVGWNGEVQPTLVAMVKREGGDSATFNSILDHLLGNKFYNQAMRRWAQNAVNIQNIAKLTFAGIPNAFQQLVNNPLRVGMQSTAVGIKQQVVDYARSTRGHIGPANELLSIVAGITDDFVRAHNRMAGGVAAENWTDRAVRAFLRKTQFSRTEAMNKAGTAHANIFFIRDQFARAAGGKLRGNNLEQARRRLGAQGIDLDRVLARWRKDGGPLENALDAVHGPGGFATAIMRGVRETQFSPMRTHIPVLWQTPYGRPFAQFKTFALNQGILLRDSVLAEAALGNMWPLAYIFSIYPLAGELVGTMSNVARGKGVDREADGAMRFLEDVLNVGGLGIVTTMVQAAAFGRLPDALLGPTVTDLLSISAEMMRLDMDGMQRQVTRQPLYQGVTSLMTATGLTLEAAVDYAEKAVREPQDAPTITLDELRLSQ